MPEVTKSPSFGWSQNEVGQASTRRISTDVLEPLGLPCADQDVVETVPVYVTGRTDGVSSFIETILAKEAHVSICELEDAFTEG